MIGRGVNMKLSIVWKGLDATDDLRVYLERRLKSALGRFGDDVADIRARLADTNGPRGGIDKQVKLLVRGRRGAVCIALAEDTSMFAAIDRATERIRLGVARALGRGRRRQRRR
jgi:ribosomal subunit interface protein